MSERFIGRVPDPFDFNHSARSRQVQPSRNLVFVGDNLGSNDLRTRSQAPARHLLGVTHQLIEMNSRGRNKCTGAPAPLHYPFALKTGQSMPGRHEADLVDLRQFSLRINRISRF